MGEKGSIASAQGRKGAYRYAPAQAHVSVAVSPFRTLEQLAGAPVDCLLHGIVLALEYSMDTIIYTGSGLQLNSTTSLSGTRWLKYMKATCSNYGEYFHGCNYLQGHPLHKMRIGTGRNL